jgi:hypothetical protein
VVAKPLRVKLAAALNIVLTISNISGGRFVSMSIALLEFR